MFAFALADPGRGQVWLARDRLGIKPLYLFRPAGGGLLFASEVRALLAAGPELVPRRLSRRAVESFLAQGVVYGDEGHVEGIRELEPGSALTVDWLGRPLRHRTYWRARAASRAEAVEAGGVDSSVLATLATEASPGPVRTVSVGFDVADYDETAVAERFARELGTEHVCVRVSAADVRTDLDTLLAAVDQPTIDGMNTFYAARAARAAGVKVVLSGLGGDEIFGGYSTFRDVPRRWRGRGCGGWPGGSGRGRR